MLKAFKYKIKPNKSQKELLEQFFGCARFIYNWGLDKKINSYKTEKKSIGYIDLAKELTTLKQQENTKWLQDAPIVCLQQALRNLDNAYTRFFKEKKGFPKFKSKKNSKPVCKFINSVHFDFDIWKVKIPKIGWVKLCKNKTFDTTSVKQTTLTVSKDNCGEYWCVILIDDLQPKKPKAKVYLQASVGIDLGIKDFAILSNGVKYGNPHFLERNQKRLKSLQKQWSKKQKGSKNKEKARLEVAKLHKRIANQRLDFCHKLTTYLVKNFDTICIEDLNVSGMMKNHHLANSIQECAWRLFRNQLEYKSEMYGKNILTIGRFEPSSKICSKCGCKNESLTLKDREWICPHCGEHHDRDVNAAINIRDFALHPQSLVANSSKL